MKTVVVIPTYNEVQNIEELISQIFYFQPEFDILVVDDNSPDGTGEVLDRLAKRSNKIKVIHRPEKDGLGGAYLTSFRYILSCSPSYQLIIQMDADFSHHPRYLGSLLEAAKDKDISIGSRYVPGARVVNRKLRRKILTSIANLFVRLWLRPGIKDCTGGFRCFKKDVLANIQFDTIKSHGYLFQIEMLSRCLSLGCSFTEVPIVFVKRREGRSKLGFSGTCKAILELPRLWVNAQ